MAVISKKDKEILSEILQDYQNLGKRKFNDDGIIQDLIKKLAPEEKTRLIKTKTEIANELGVTRKTLMGRILSHGELLDELVDAGWRPKSRIFYPKEVEILKKYLF
jgi:hypothetical protein